MAQTFDLTFTEPTLALEFILSSHRDAFFYFLLNGPQKPLTPERTRKAIDFVIDVIGEEHEDKKGKPLNRGASQFFINERTKEGVQNLYAVRFIAELLID